MNNNIYEIYKDILDITKNVDSFEKINAFYIQKIKGILKKLHDSAHEYNLIFTYIQTDKIYELLNKKTKKEDYEIIYNSIITCKKIIEIEFSNKTNVLICSNKMDNFNILIEYLKLKGFNVIIENENTNLIEIINLNKPNIILIDDDNDENGITIFKMIKDEVRDDNVVVLVIGAENKNLKLQALALGAIDYIVKPFDDEEVFMKIRNIVNLNKQHIKYSIYDMLTGVYSRKYGEKLGNKEFKKGLSLLVIDIDYMAEINIKYGSLIGNSIIQDIAQILIDNVDSDNIIYRNSGDEFVILFLNKEQIEVLKIANKMQQDLKSLHNKYNVNISFSGGISHYNKSIKSYNELLDIALEILKKSKHDGKGIIYTSDELNNYYDKYNILFIDNDKILSSILEIRYKNKGYEIYTSDTWEHGQSILKKEKIDIVITDYYVKGVLIDEIIKYIKEINRNTKIIVLSSKKTESSMEKSLNLGVDDYILKPFSPVELDLRIKKILN